MRGAIDCDPKLADFEYSIDFEVLKLRLENANRFKCRLRLVLNLSH